MRHGKSPLLFVLAGALLGWLASAIEDPGYEARVRLAGSGIEQRAASAFTRRNLGEVIKRHGLYTERRRHEPLENVVERLRRDLHIRSVGSQEAELVFRYNEPSGAGDAAAELANVLGAVHGVPATSEASRRIWAPAGGVGAIFGALFWLAARGRFA